MLQSQPAGLPVRPVAELAGVSDRFSPRSERLLALRTELLLTQAHTQGQACVLAVIGALPGEGRSRLATELAIAFAQLRDSTLLVDANMRRPGLQRYFEGANGSAGLAQALAGGPLPSVQPVEGLPDLGFLSAGNVPANPLDLLSDVRFEELVAAWRDRYRFVVIDTPPVSECADALAVAHAAGRALVVCRTDQTTYDAARSMLRRLAMTQAEVVGAVLNSF
jgi:receptor protein-tyrosine kinase